MHIKSLKIWAPGLLISVHQERIMICMRIPVAENKPIFKDALRDPYATIVQGRKPTPELTDKELGTWPAHPDCIFCDCRLSGGPDRLLCQEPQVSSPAALVLTDSPFAFRSAAHLLGY